MEMNLTDWIPVRTTGQVYRKKRSRPRPSSSSTSSVTEVNNVTTPPRILAAGEQLCNEEVDLHGSFASNRAQPSTPSSSPSRKRTTRCQTSSPAKSSSRPPSNAANRLTSNPVQPLRRSTSHALLAPGPADVGVDDEPRKSSFADRMKPRVRPGSVLSSTTALVEAAQSDPIESREEIGQDYEAESSQTSSNNEASSQNTIVTLPVEVVGMMSTSAVMPSGQQKKYQRIRGQPPQTADRLEDSEVNDEEAMRIAKKPNLGEIRKRWAELDDLNDDDGEDEESTTKSIIGLRNKGQSKQCQEDFQYLVMDLTPSQSLPVRRATCIEICTKMLQNQEEEADRDSNEEVCDTADYQNRSDMDTSSGPSAFFDYIRANGFIETVWRQMRGAGAGQGKDESIDLALLLICTKVSLCSPSLLQALCGEADFTSTVIAGLRESAPRPRSVNKDSAPLLHLAQAVMRTPPSSEEGLLRQLSLVLLANLIDLRDDHGIDCLIDTTSQFEGRNVFQLLWATLAVERARTMEGEEGRKTDGRAIAHISRIIASCVDNVKGEDLQATSFEDVVSLLCYYGQLAFDSTARQYDAGADSLDVLSSLLRMVVAIMALESQDWRPAFLEQEGFLTFVVRRTMDAAAHLFSAKDTVVEGERAHREVFTLFLALLTDILTVKAVEVRTALLQPSFFISSQGVERQTVGETSSPLALFGRLLSNAQSAADIDPEAGCLAGSLSVVLALLTIGQARETDTAITSDDGGEESQERMLVLQALCRGLQCENISGCLQHLISTIEDFAAVVKTASRRVKAMHGKMDVEAGSREDAAFFSYLLEGLRRLQSQSSASDTPDGVGNED